MIKTPMAMDKDTTNLSSPPPEARLYADNVSHGQRLTSVFDSSTLVSNGKALGVIDVPPAMAATIRSMLDQFLPYGANWLGDNAVRVAQQFTHKFVTDNPEKAVLYGNRLGRGMAYGLISIQPIAETTANALSTAGKLKELRGALIPILKANGKSTTGAGIFTDSNNEVVHNARQKIFSASMNDMAGTLARTVSLLPSFYILAKKQNANIAEQSKDAELELLLKNDTPEKLDDYINKHMENVAETNMKLEGQFQKRLTEQRKKYYDEFNRFSDKEKTNVTKEIENGINDTTASVYLEKYGYVSSHVLNTTEDLPKLLQRNKDRMIKDRLKERFAEEGGLGAWDADFMPGYKNSKNRPKSRSEIITETQQKIIEKIHDKQEGGKGKARDKEQDAVITQATQLLATLGGETLRSIVTGSTNKKLQDKLALDMILDMRRALDENSQRDSIPGGSETNRAEEYSFAHFVHKIFQEHQHDCQQAEVGERYVRSMKAVSWDDKDIQKMSDADLNPYEVAIKHISQYIRDGRMDPLALINLVGERKIVARSGKSFGTLKSGDDETKKENIIAEIDRQAALLRPNHKMEENEISEALGNYIFSKEELQAAFSNHGLEGDAKAFLFTLLDMNTPDDKVLQDLTGRTTDEIKHLRLDSQKRFSLQLDAALREVASDLTTNPAAMERYNLTEEEAQRFISIYQQAKQTGSAIGDSLDSNTRKAVASSVANILVEDTLHHSGSFWRERVKPHAAKTEQEQKQQSLLKQEEKQQRAQSLTERYAMPPESQASQGFDVGNSYLSDQPYISRDMQQHWDKPRQHSHRQRLHASPGAELGMAP